MTNTGLPPERVLNNAFKERGRENVVKIDVLPVHDGELLKVVFEEQKSPWRQGVFLKTDTFVVVNKQQCPSVQVWQDSAPENVLIECHTKDGILHLYNVWDRGKGRESQLWSSGMIVEELPDGRRYRCNDIGFNTNFDKLVFRVERTSKK